MKAVDTRSPREGDERPSQKKTPPSRARRVLSRLGRAALVLAFAGVLAGGWAYHRARAQLSESFFGLGEQMMQFADVRAQDAPRDLVLNGQTIRFSSGTADQPMETLLDAFEARCGEVDGELVEQIEHLRVEHPEAGADAPASSPTLREQNARSGYVACLDLGQQSLPVSELAERIASFGRTGDVADIGDMRYVFTEQYEHEGATRTHFVAMWTRGAFNVQTMFPDAGDAPGRDVQDLPRPPGSRRVLSGFERDVPTSMTVYSARTDEAALESHFRSAFRENGWSVVETAEQVRSANAPTTIIAERDARMVTVVVATDAARGGATAAVFQTE